MGVLNIGRGCILCLLMLVMCAACRGQSGAGLASSAGKGDGVAEANTGQLPSFAELDRLLRRPSAITTWRMGAHFAAELPSRGVTPAGDNWLDFAASEPDQRDTAFAVYSFKLEGMETGAVIQSAWNVYPPSKARWLAAVANRSSQRWEIFQTSNDYSFFLPRLADYLDPQGVLLVAMFWQSAEAGALRRLDISPFDLYDEIEPNSTKEQAQLLPPAPFTAFRASAGADLPGYAGNDGSNDDWFELNLQPGTDYSIGILSVGALHAAGEKYELFEGDELLESEALHHELLRSTLSTAPAGGGPYYLHVLGRGLDYEISLIEGNSQAPVPGLNLEPRQGPAPLLVQLDASSSYDSDGTIVSYEFDFEGDGVWDLITNSPLAQHTYEEEGLFKARVRVRDDAGWAVQMPKYGELPGERSVTVGPSPYDEVEDNDGRTPDDYNQLPALPFAGFSGSVSGSDYFYNDLGYEYDADSADCFTFEATAGVPVSFRDANFFETAVSDDNGSNLGFALYGLDGKKIHGTNPQDQHISFVPAESGSYKLSVHASRLPDHHRYELIGLNSYPPNPPHITLSKTEGKAPLSVSCSASVSDPDSTDLQFSWSVDDVYADASLGHAASIDFSFEEAGDYVIRCFATDETGLRSSETAQVFAWARDYDEREYNSDFFEAQLLPALPVSNFTGSLAGLNDGGYDGFTQDYFRLPQSLSAGSSLHVEVLCERHEASMKLELLDGSKAVLAQASPVEGVLTLDFSTGDASLSSAVLLLSVDPGVNPVNVNYELNVSVD